MKAKRTNKAVSEIVGTILLLGIAVSLFSTVYIFVINESLNPSDHPPAVNIIGTTEGKNIVFENRGGESLPSDSIICFLSVAGEQMNMTIGPYLQDTNGNGLWDVGEKLVFNSSNLGVDITNLQIDAAIIDKTSGSLVMQGTLQEGEIYEYPYVFTMDATNVESDRAELWMDYNFRNYTGDLRFAYKDAVCDWNYTDWFGCSGEGSYGKIVTGLIPETVYFFKAQLKYDNETLEDVVKSFTTLGIVAGMWHFDTGSGIDAIDSSGRNNDGKLYYGPQWTTTSVNGTALSYDGIDDYVTVPYHSSLDITDEITIEAWMKPLENSEGYYGKIPGPVLDTSSFGIFDIYDPDIIHVSGDIYAVACRGDGNDGFLVTVEIANDGRIDYTLIDIFEFYTADCYEPDIIHVDGTVYAIAYRSGWTAYVRTVEIFNDGRISRTIKATLPFATTYREPHIFYISGTTYAIGYTGPGYDSYLTTIGIAINGQINGVLDTIVFDTALAGVSEEPNMIHVYGDIYAIAYRNPDSDGELRTVNITSDGQITAPSHFMGDYIDQFLFDAFDGFEPNITHIDGNIYAVAYGGFKSAGTLRTMEIYNDGTIEKDIIDAFEFDSGASGYGREPSIIHINGDVYAIAYRGPGDDGWLKTVKIASNGTINSNIVDSYEFDTSACYEPGIIRVNGDVYAIVYRGSNDDGLLKTVQIASDGTISKPAIDYSEFGIFDCQQPDMIQISDSICAIAFRGFYDDGFLRTVEIASDGTINDSIIDSFKFHSGQVLDPMIIHVSGDVYALVYSNYSGVWQGFLKTVRITSSGNITGIINSLEFETSQGYRPDIVHVSGDIYAIAYYGPSGHGYVKTVKITSDGTITVAGMDTKEFDASYCNYPDIIHVTGDVYAIAYTGSSSDGYLKTVKITSGGMITTSGMDTLEFETSYCVFPDIINVTGDIYAIAYTGPSDDGFVRTVKIDGNGTIIGGYIDNFEFDDYYGYQPDIIHIKDRVFAIAYTRWYRCGYLKTLRIGENGEITNSADSTYQFDSWVYEYAKCRIVHINGSVFAIAYRNPYNDGLVKTIKIEYTPRVGYIVAKDNCYRINANSTTVFAYINGAYLTAPISSGFNYVVLTYNKNAGGSDQMKLYVDSTLENWTSYSASINTNGNHLYFGEMNSIVDEITLWRSAITQTEITQHYNDLTGG